MKTSHTHALKTADIFFYRERLASEDELLVDMGSDQTSLHNPYNGGYYPVGLSFDEANLLMTDDPGKFKKAVQTR